MNSLASVEQRLLLELRTEAGAVYLCPSRFERLRLQWTFRHFRTLPAQLLSRRDQRLIEKLCQSAVVTPFHPVPNDAIFGVVERKQLPVLAADALPRSGWDPRWGRLGALAATVMIVAGLLIAGRLSLHRLHAVPVAHAAMQDQTLSGQQMQVADPVTAPVPSQTPLPSRHSAVATVVRQRTARSLSLTPAPVTEESADVKRWVTELPSGHFVRPVVGHNSPVGEVQLSALIAPDGSVQEVRSLHGDPALAQAGIRAVRQWRYPPYGAAGAPAEEETQIRMNFFGPDAVSIAVQPR